MVFSSARSVEKIERMQEVKREPCLRFLYNDHRSSYEELLAKSGKCIMHENRPRCLCIDILKQQIILTLNSCKIFSKLEFLKDLHVVQMTQSTIGPTRQHSVRIV